MLAWAAAADVPRTSSGKPDLSGTYNVATLTPLERPEEFGDNLYLTPAEAQKITDKQASDRADAHQVSDPNRTAPPPGGDGSPGAAGNVGGYNSFWIDNGDDPSILDGKFRTSIITYPQNGRQPPMTASGQQRMAGFLTLFKENTGTAWWLDQAGPGPYDDMELRPNAERCMLSFGSTSGPPMLPSAYNNLKRVVQTESHVMILAEMIHDARVIRLDGEHNPSEHRTWMGDSVGHWEGDTLVVDTTNFGPKPALLGADSNLHVIERFTRLEDGNLKYAFTVDNRESWETSWGGEYPWPRTDDKVYEYACHEGNYALGNIMRGARILEADIEGVGGQE
jgi:hypothetical protein